ncbi:MAG: CxxC-x17-CxxC domain-containing protein [bacterium]
MKDFRRPSGQGRDRDGGQGFGGGYNKYSSNRDSGERGERREVLHRAVCSECNNTCEVPFRPNGSKPVYCKDCFGKKKGAYPSNNEKPAFAPRAEHTQAPRPQTQAPDGRIDKLVSEMNAVHAKLERIIKMIENNSSVRSVESVVVPAMKKAYDAVEKIVEKAPVKSIEKNAVKAPAKKKAVVVVKKPVAKSAPKAKPITKKKK